MEKLRALTAPKGTGSLLCLAPSPHDEGATLAAAGEDGAAVVFDLRGDSLVAHRLSADAGCFSAGDAVTSVAYARARDPSGEERVLERMREFEVPPEKPKPS